MAKVVEKNKTEAVVVDDGGGNETFDDFETDTDKKNDTAVKETKKR